MAVMVAVAKMMPRAPASQSRPRAPEARPPSRPVRTRPTVRRTSRSARGAMPTSPCSFEALGLGPGVADLEAGYGRGGGQDRPRDEAGSRSAGDDPDVDDALAPAVEGGVEEGPEAGDAVLGAGEAAVEHVERAAEEDEGGGREPCLGRRAAGGDAGDAGSR